MDARCPRCSTVFTTDRSGIQFCPNCGQQVDVPEPARAAGPGGWDRQPPGGGGPGAGRFTGEPPPGGSGGFPGGRELTPWERRKELGFFPAFFETWKRSVLSPQSFFPTVRPDVPWSEALFYAWIIHAIDVVLLAPLVGLGLFRNSLHSLGSDPQTETLMRAFSGGFGIGSLIVSLAVYPLIVLAGSGIIHLVAMLFGAARNGYGGTVRAVCYAAGPNILSFIPCVGFLAGIYTLVLTIFGIASLQETTMGKAAGIVLLPIVLVGCCCGFLFSAILAAVAGMVGSMSGSGGTSL